ncbi:MAG: BTB/POZ domain-containing protein [Parachlamydiales bacterium]|jgi:hypothetical protein
MTSVSDNTVGENYVYNVTELQQAINQGSIVVNGHTKYFYELINDDNFIKNPELYQVALTCISLSKDLSGTDSEKYEQLVRGYTLLNNPKMTSLVESKSNEDSINTYENILKDCEKKFIQNLKKFISIRNKLINKPTTDIEKKITNEGSKIILRLNQLDQISPNRENSLSEKGLRVLTQSMMRSSDDEVQAAWRGIVEKVVNLLHFDANDPKNLESVENSLLNGEYDEIYMYNALTSGETFIDGKKESFRELLKDSKFLNHPQLYNILLKVIDSLKNKEKLNELEMQQLVTAYQILNNPTVPSLPERRYYQIFAKYTYNNAIAFCESAFLREFDSYLAAREKVIGSNSWLEQFKGKEQSIQEKINSLSSSYRDQWNAIKAAIIQISTSQPKAFEAKKQWSELVNTLKDSSSNFFQNYEVENYLLRGIIPFSVQNPEDDQEDHFNMVDAVVRENNEFSRDEVSLATKKLFKEGLQTGYFSVNDDNFSEFYELSLKYNIPSLKESCIRHVTNGTMNLNKVRFLHKLNELDNQNLKDEIKKFSESIDALSTKEYLKNLINTPSEFKEFIEKSKKLDLINTLKICESVFQAKIVSLMNVRADLVISDDQKLTRNETDFVYDQARALNVKPKDIDLMLGDAIELGLSVSAGEAYSQLLKNTCILCTTSPLPDLEDRIFKSNGRQHYLDVVKKYAVKMAEIDPKNEQFKMIAALFNNNLFSPEEGQELFKYIFYQVGSSHPKGGRTFNTEDVYSRSSINSLNLLNVIALYQKSFNVADKIGIEGLKNYLAHNIFSLGIVSRKLKEELATLDETKKNEFIGSVRSSLFTLLSYPSHELGWLSAKEILSIDNETREHVKSNYEFNDPKTSDITVLVNPSTEASGGTSSPSAGLTLRLHKSVLGQSTYFRSFFTSGLRETNLPQITINEEESEAFLELVKFMYDGKLAIDENNVIALLELTKKYHVEPHILIAAQVHLWFSDYIKKLKEKVQEGDPIDAQTWNVLLEIFNDPHNEFLMNSKSLREDIYKYLILSVNTYMKSIDEQKEPNLTHAQAKERLQLLENTRDSKMGFYLRKRMDKFFNNLKSNYEKYDFGTDNKVHRP